MEQQNESNHNDAKQRYKQIEFYFPSSQFMNLKFNSIFEVRDYFINQKSAWNKIFYCTTSKNYIFAQCKVCKMRITLKETNGIYQVIKFTNQHHHPLKKNKIVQEQQIKDYVKRNKISMETLQGKKIVSKAFSLTKSRFYFIKNKITSESKPINSLLMELQMNQYKIQFFDWSNKQLLPQVLVISSSSMQIVSKNLSDFIHFDIIENICKVKANDGTTDWKVGIFTGYRQNLSQCILAIVFIKRLTSQNLIAMIKLYIKISTVIPKTIITNQISLLGQQIQKLNEQQQYKINHFLDQYYILDQIKEKIQRDQRQKYMPLFQKIIFSKNLSQIKVCLQSVQQIDNPQLQQYIHNYFNIYFRQFCEYFCPKIFHGVLIKRGSYQNIIPSIKRCFRAKREVSDILRKIQNRQKKHTQTYFVKQNQKFTKNFKDQQLENVRNLLQKRAFKFFFQKYVNSFNIKIIDDNLSKDSRNSIHFQTQKFKIKDPMYDQSYSTFYIKINECQCGDSQKSGLACIHLIALRKELKVTYADLIANRWKLKPGQDKKPHRFKPKLSRRRNRGN